MTRQTITVDITPGKDPVKRLNLTQGDIGRPLGVYIKQNDVALDCSGYTAELYVLKPDGNYFSSLLTVDETETNLITWETALQETPLAGECAAQIRIRQGTINIGTAEFVEYIEESPNQIGIDSETDVELLEQYVSRAAVSAQNAVEAASHYPRINTTTQTWEVWDVATGRFVDTGESIGGSILANVEVVPHAINIGIVAAGAVVHNIYTLRKDGYYPLGIVGSHIDYNGAMLIAQDIHLADNRSNIAIIEYTIKNTDSVGYGNMHLIVDLLWIKE